MRRKIFFPNLFQYAATYQRTEWELIKKNSEDSPVSYSTTPVGKAYGNIENMCFFMNKVHFFSKRERSELNPRDQKSLAEETPQTTAEDDDDEQIFGEIMNMLRPERKTFTMREATTKANPFKKDQFI